MSSVTAGKSITGQLVTDLEGNILKSGGDLQNEESTGHLMHKMINCVPRITDALNKPQTFNKIVEWILKLI